MADSLKCPVLRRLVLCQRIGEEPESPVVAAICQAQLSGGQPSGQQRNARAERRPGHYPAPAADERTWADTPADASSPKSEILPL